MKLMYNTQQIYQPCATFVFDQNSIILQIFIGDFSFHYRENIYKFLQQRLLIYFYLQYLVDYVKYLYLLLYKKPISIVWIHQPTYKMQNGTKFVILLSLMLSEEFVSSFDYDPTHTLQCTHLSDYDGNITANLTQLWNVLILHVIERIVFLVACPILLIAQTIVIILFTKHRQLRSKPGNIFFGLVIIQMVLNIHLFISSIYRTIFISNSIMPESFVPFCSAMGLIASFFSLLHFMYLILFMFHTVFIFRFTLKKKSQAFWTMLHVFVMISSLGLTLFFYFQNYMGLNFYGLCGVTATRRTVWSPILPSVQIFCSIIFMFLGILTYVYFRKHMPSGQQFRKRKIQQGKTIFMYVTGFSTSLIFMSVMNLILELNCTQQIPIPQVNVLVTILNISRLLQFCLLLFLICYNDRFRRKLKHFLKGFFQKTFIRSSSHNMIEDVQMEDVFFNQKLLELKYRSNQIDLLLLSQIYTIISGIYIAYFQYYRDFTQKQKLRRINFVESVTFNIDNRTIIDYQTQSRLLVKLKILACQITIHSPKVFKQLLDMDNLVDVFQSFHIVDNSRKLSNLAEGIGGKSGEFFFFSSDNKYVIKTITEEEFAFYKENLSTFYDYYLQNPLSLLAKILGLFTIKGDQMQRTYNLILMKNILGCNKKQILRLYDLKGSKYDRQVLFSQIQTNEVSKMTLKDIDFINYQSVINVSPTKSKQLRQTLRKDSLFLKSLNLLDYSLLVVRVKWTSQPQNPSFWGELQRMAHFYQEGEYYHIGIIDYMQKWDFNKKSQKWWKNLTGKKDFSAQQPNKYQMRFMQFVDEITSGPRKNDKKTSKISQISGIQLKQVRAITVPEKEGAQIHSLIASLVDQQRNTQKMKPLVDKQ